MTNGIYTTEYLRKRTIVRRWFWSPIVAAETIWIIGMLFF